jgi:hypothetical protein
MRGSALLSPVTRERYGPFQCDECGVMSIGHGQFSQGAMTVEAQMIAPDAPLSWLPERFSGKPYPDVPEHIASAASEAHTCFSAQAYRGAIILARAVVEATAKDKGATTGTLAAKIQKLYDDKHVRELIKDTADEIRHMGNDMAHGDFVDPVSKEEAEDVLEFMAEVLDEVYQAPARVNARRDERLARKAAAQQS